MATDIEHIGSTAVPGLAAKPIIDILLVVDDPADEASYLPALQDAGYELRVREPDFDEHRMLRTADRDVHVHVFPPWSQEIDRYLDGARRISPVSLTEVPQVGRVGGGEVSHAA